MQEAKKKQDHVLTISEGKLSLKNLGIRHLANLNPSYFDNLVELDLSHNNLRTLNVSMLTTLRKLNASHNEIEKVESLKNLHLLRALILDSNMLDTLSDIGGLKDLKKLERLNVSNNWISEISPDEWESIEGVKKLDLSYNFLEKIGGLRILKKLKNLKIQDNEIVDLSELSLLQRLKKLHLSNDILSKPKKPKDQKKNRRVIEALEGANVTIIFSDD